MKARGKRSFVKINSFHYSQDEDCITIDGKLVTGEKSFWGSKEWKQYEVWLEKEMEFIAGMAINCKWTASCENELPEISSLFLEHTGISWEGEGLGVFFNNKNEVVAVLTQSKSELEEMVLKDEGLKLKLMFNHHRYEVEHEERKKRALKKEKEGKRKEMKEKKEEGADLRENKKRMAEPLGTVDRCFRGREAFKNSNWQRSTTLSSWFGFPTMIFQGLRGVQYGVGPQELLRAAVLGGKVQTKKEVVAS